MGYYDNNAKGVGLSYKNGVVNFNTLVAAGASFISALCANGKEQIGEGDDFDPATYGDPMFATYCDEAYKQNLPFLAHFIYGVRAKDYQAGQAMEDNQFKALQYSLKNKTFHAIMLEIGDEDDTGSNIRKKLEKFIGWVKDYYPNKPVIIYAKESYITKFGEELVTLIAPKENPFPMNMLQVYPQNVTVLYNVSFTQANSYLPTEEITVSTPGFAKRYMWSWKALSNLVGTSGGLSTAIVWNGTKELMYSQLSFTPSTAVVEEPVDDTVVDDTTDDTVDDTVDDTTTTTTSSDMLSRISDIVARIDLATIELAGIRSEMKRRNDWEITREVV